jgi:hypothetical protein
MRLSRPAVQAPALEDQGGAEDDGGAERVPEIVAEHPDEQLAKVLRLLLDREVPELDDGAALRERGATLHDTPERRPVRRTNVSSRPRRRRGTTYSISAEGPDDTFDAVQGRRAGALRPSSRRGCTRSSSPRLAHECDAVPGVDHDGGNAAALSVMVFHGAHPPLGVAIEPCVVEDQVT